MIINRIEIVPSVELAKESGEYSVSAPAIQIRECKEDGGFHRRCIVLDGTQDLAGEPPETQAAAEAALSIPESTDLQRIDFECGKQLNQHGEWEYSDKAFQIRTKTKATAGKPHRPMVVAPLRQCPETGKLIDTDVDNSELPDELKAVCKKLFACEGVKEGFREVAEEHLRKAAARKAAKDAERKALIEEIKRELEG